MKERRRNNTYGRHLSWLLSVFIFLIGFCVYVYPYANRVWTDYALRQDAVRFLSFVQIDFKQPDEEARPTENNHKDLTAETEPTESLPDIYPELWQQMLDYNESIFLNGQEGLSNESSYEVPSFILADYGLESEVFAVLEIPALKLSMPIYLGATKQHMADGAAHMTHTSLPIGGLNTNCVIAGHRGWNGAAYFLYVPNLKKGDIVTVTNLWETLTYEVVETRIISPHDVEAIHIQPNRDLLTLLTCHPPATGGRQRYLVFCERIQTELEVP